MMLFLSTVDWLPSRTLDQLVEPCENEECCTACCTGADEFLRDLSGGIDFALFNACLPACRDELKESDCASLTLQGIEDDVVQQSCLAGLSFKSASVSVFEFNATGNAATFCCPASAESAGMLVNGNADICLLQAPTVSSGDNKSTKYVIFLLILLLAAVLGGAVMVWRNKEYHLKKSIKLFDRV